MSRATESGSENRLVKKLGFFPLTNIVIANMIGAGIFTTSGLLMKDLGNAWVMLLLWGVGGFVALCGALCYSELGAAIPRAGGEYIFLSRLFHPILGFLSGWVSFFVGFSAPIAASAIGVTEYLARAFPEISRLGILESKIEELIFRKVIAAIIIIIFMLIHMRGIEIGARVQNVLTLLKVALIVGIVVLGFSSGNGNMDHFSRGSSFRFDFGDWKILGLSLMWIMFSYSGWNASAYIGSEIKKPRKNLPLSLIVGTGAVIVLYFALNLFYIYAASPEEMGGVISIGGLAAGNLFGSSVGDLFSVLISFALFSSLSAYIILGPRVYYSMAKDGHFFRFAAKVNRASHAPAGSILLQSVIAIVIVFSGSFDQILTYMGFSLGIFPILAVFGVFKLRRLNMSAYKMPGFPAVPVLYILFAITILVLGFLERPVVSSIAILTVAAGIPAYFLFKKRYGVKRSEG